MVDLMVVGAHPDDAELHAGGLMAKLSRRGARVLLVDATAGEFGTRGTREERAEEGAEAARILGVQRACLGLPDGSVGADPQLAMRAFVMAIREHRPAVVLTHAPGDHHPDHQAVSEAVKRATFMANVLRYDTGQERFAPRKLFYYWGHRHQPPPPNCFVTDITETYETKVAALRAHRSQFHNPGYEAPSTFVSSEQFWRAVEARAAYYGSLAWVRYAEAFVPVDTLHVDDPLAAMGHPVDLPS